MTALTRELIFFSQSFTVKEEDVRKWYRRLHAFDKAISSLPASNIAKDKHTSEMTASNVPPNPYPRVINIRSAKIGKRHPVIERSKEAAAIAAAE